MSDLINFVQKIAKMKKDGGICSTQNKLTLLQEKINFLKKQSFKDDPFVISSNEQRLLGIALSANKIDIFNDERITHSCLDVLSAAQNEQLTIGVDIIDVKESETKSGKSQGKKKASLTVCDKSAKIRCQVWSDVFEVYNNLLIKGNSVILIGSKGFGRYQDLFIVSSVIQP